MLAIRVAINHQSQKNRAPPEICQPEHPPPPLPKYTPLHMIFLLTYVNIVFVSKSGGGGCDHLNNTHPPPCLVPLKQTNNKSLSDIM